MAGTALNSTAIFFRFRGWLFSFQRRRFLMFVDLGDWFLLESASGCGRISRLIPHLRLDNFLFFGQIFC